MSVFAIAARLGRGLFRSHEARDEAALDAPDGPVDERASMQLPVELPGPPPQNDLAPVLAGRDPCRYEFKYWVPEPIAANVVRHIEPHVKLDLYGGEDELGQCNTSLYLDTPDLACYHSHIESSLDRFKLRVRVYGDPPSGPAFFETKRKLNNVTIKTRCMVTLPQMTELLLGNYDALATVRPDDRPALESFLYWQNLTHAEPMVLVRARRAAFASHDPADDIRVTIDRQIGFQRAQGPTMDYDENCWTPLDGELQHERREPHALLELKFPRIAPGWMLQLTDKLEMWRVGYSKYVWSIQTMQEQAYSDDLLRDSRSFRGF